MSSPKAELIGHDAVRPEIKGMVSNIQKFSTHDGPGIRTTVFLKSCPLRCKWCDNPETWQSRPVIMFVPIRCRECGKCVAVCPEGAISMDKENKIDWQRCTTCLKCADACKYDALRRVGTEMTAEEVDKVVRGDEVFYRCSGGGVTISGGEPLVQPDFTAEIFRLCRKVGIHTALDTSGFGSAEDVAKVIRYVDLVLLDLKIMDPVEHIKITGVPNESILNNAKYMAGKTEVRISFPLVKGVNDSMDNLRAMAEFCKPLGIKAIDVEPLHKLAGQKYTFLGLESPFGSLEKMSDAEVEEVRNVFHSYGFETTRARAF